MERRYPSRSEDSIETAASEARCAARGCGLRPDAEESIEGRGRSLGHQTNVILVFVSTCVLIGGLSCPSETGRPVTQPSEELTVFFTGSELGSLRPCGCSGGQLGGLEKRTAIFSRVPAANRLIVETGALVRGDSEQDLIKFRVIFEALRRLGYDVARLTHQDLDIAGRLGLLADRQQGFEIIGTADRSPVFARRFTSQGREIVVRVVAVDPEVTPLENTAELIGAVAGVSTLDILILQHCGPGLLKVLAAQVPGVECVICPSDSDEPQLVSGPDARPLVFAVGRFGRYICRLDAAVTRQTEELVLQFERIPVEEKLPDDEVLVQLYRQYQQLVKDSNLLERHPRLPLPQDIVFAGSRACRPCHEYEYDRWSTKAHADALASLKRVGSDHDPECVVCHVTGMDYDSGFVTEAGTPHLKDVGCENCHGPGSEHIRTSGQTATTQPKMTCLDCHTPEKSAGYAGHEEEYMQKIIHWREPAAAGNVKID